MKPDCADSVVAEPRPVRPVPLSLREAAITVLIRTGQPMRAAEIVAHFRAFDLKPCSTSATPTQSINRDLHAALRRGDTRIALGPAPGVFLSTDRLRATPSTPLPTRPAPRGPRLPVEPLQRALSPFTGPRGGLLAGQGVNPSLRTAYRRAVKRGWISLHTADALCVHVLRTHPCIIWGDAWWDAPCRGKAEQ